MIKIITFYYKNYNYGGLLQAYALQKFLALHSYDCEQIAFDRTIQKRPIMRRVRRLTPHKIFHILLRLFNYFLTLIILNKLMARKGLFDKFIESISHSPVCCSADISDMVTDDDIVIAGSDQIWNPDWTTSAYFLDFVPDINGKISYAASIGKSLIPQASLCRMGDYLHRFDYVSVREESAKLLLEPYARLPIKVVLDPTLLLDQTEWDKITVQPKISEPYMFVYLLGKNAAHRSFIKYIAQKLKLKIVFLPHLGYQFNYLDFNFGDEALFAIGPSEFIGLIQKAQIVFTDSFHGCVFSILNKKQFYVLKHKNESLQGSMNSRLYTLLNSLDLNNRFIENFDFNKRDLFSQDMINYDIVMQKLDALRKDSADFLLNAIESVRKRMENDKQAAK